MRLLSARNFLLIYALAAAGCRDEAGEPPRNSSSGADLGADAGGRCEGTIAPRGSSEQPVVRRESVWCYRAEVVGGQIDCLPSSDSQLIPLIARGIQSCGTVIDFVIAEAYSAPLTASCDAVLACCAAQSHDSGWFNCMQPFTTNPPASDCSDVNLEAFDCSADTDAGRPLASALPDSDAGPSAEPASHGICCYQTCGHTHCT